MQGTVVFLNIRLTTSLPRNFLEFFNRLRYDGIMVMSLWPGLSRFLASHVCVFMIDKPCKTAEPVEMLFWRELSHVLPLPPQKKRSRRTLAPPGEYD